MSAFLVYVATIVAANVAITYIGLVPVGFGLLAPAGVYAAGVSFTARDITQDQLGRGMTIAAIVCGALLSAFLSPSLALASGLAFLVSEGADMAVYTPLRERHWLGAVALSNTVGLVIDSALFLWLAFGSLDFLAGQVVGKVEMTVLAVVVLAVWRQRRRQTVEAVA
jgi:queuosine precursor transporter